jgi:SSS family solute:Na+ symporter
LSILDWLIVIVLNGAIIAYGLFRGRETKTSTDWFLAGKTLPWWTVGLSLYATAIDSSDLVADSGGVYTLGFQYFVTNWVGTTLGWVLLANFIAIPMFRMGMYTNAEYLEARFGAAARVISALVQVQYRTMVLGIIATTIYLTLTIVCGWDARTTWTAVFAIALLASIYTAFGGLKSVALTDALQSVVMLIASLVLFAMVWNAVGGWGGIEQKLDAHSPGLSDDLLHVGRDSVDTLKTNDLTATQIERHLLLGGTYDAEAQSIERRTPVWIVCISFLIVGMSYSIVNHTQSMRLFGARSEWDMRMAVVVSSGILLIVTFTNLMIGIMGRALYPDLASMPGNVAQHGHDAIYPLLVSELTSLGFQGLVVAGVLAASFSTFDSIGSTLSSLLVRDVYARLLVKDRDDSHYLRVGRWLTPLVIFGSFGYVPFLQAEGMLLFFLNLVGVFVVPLLTVYLMGFFTRVHRQSGALGILAGVVYGVLRLFAPKIALTWGVAVLPPLMVDSFAGSFFGLLITAGAMVLISLVRGWEPRGELLHEETSAWLKSSQQAARAISRPDQVPTSWFWPLALGVAMVLIGAWLSFVLFW